MKKIAQYAAMGLMVLVMMILASCGGGGSSSGSNGGVPQLNPMPSISGLSPASVVVGGQALTLTINGSGFVAGSTVTFDGTAKAANVVSASQITIPVTIAEITTTGNRNVVVTNPAPGGGSVLATFVIKDKPWTVNGTLRALAKAGNYLYAAYDRNNSSYLVRFDTNGDKAPIGSSVEVLLQSPSQVPVYPSRPVNMLVFGGYAYVDCMLDEGPVGYGEVFREKVDLSTGAKTEVQVVIYGRETRLVSDGTGTIWMAWTNFDQNGTPLTGLMGFDLNGNVIYAKGFAPQYQISTVAVDASSFYIGGTINNGAGGQARMYIARYDRGSGNMQWENQLTAFNRSANDDVLYTRSFVLSPVGDALYASGELDFFTSAKSGVLLRMVPSTGAFAWAKQSVGSEINAHGILAVDGSDLYGYNDSSDTIVQLDPTVPLFTWRAGPANGPDVMIAADGIVYAAINAPSTGGRVTLLSRVAGAPLN